MLCTLLAVPAAAGPAILIESHPGPRPQEAAALVSELQAALAGELQPLQGEQLRRRIEEAVSRSAGAGQPARKLRAAVEEGGRLFIEGEFGAAITQLETARRQLLLESAALAADQTLRDILHRALLFLAHAYLKNQQGEQATERIAEVIRSFPDRDLSLVQVQYGPELVSLYRQVRAELDRQGRGTLVVNTEPPGCLVFLDERFVGVSPARIVDLYPGRYRVFLQRQQAHGRVRGVTVTTGEQTLRIPFLLDGALRTSPFVGFRFGSLERLEQEETSLAAELGRSLEASSVLLVGYRRHQGRKALLGSAVSPVTGRLLRSAIVVVEPLAPSAETLRALGRFLLDGQGGAGLIIRSSGVASPPARSGGFLSARVFKWVTLGLSIGCLGGGISLLALHGRGTCADPQRRCPETYDTLLPGILLGSAGALAGAGSGLLFYWDRRGAARRAPAAALLPLLGPHRAGLAGWLEF